MQAYIFTVQRKINESAKGCDMARLAVMALCIKRLPSNGTAVSTDCYRTEKLLTLTKPEREPTGWKNFIHGLLYFQIPLSVEDDTRLIHPFPKVWCGDQYNNLHNIVSNVIYNFHVHLKFPSTTCVQHGAWQMLPLAHIDLWKPEQLSELHGDVGLYNVTMMKSHFRTVGVCDREREYRLQTDVRHLIIGQFLAVTY